MTNRTDNDEVAGLIDQLKRAREEGDGTVVSALEVLLAKAIAARSDADAPMWEVSGTLRGKPVTAQIQARDYNEAVRKGSSGAGNMMVVKAAKMLQTEKEKGADREKAIAAYTKLSARGDTDTSGTITAFDSASLAKLDVAMAKAAKLDSAIGGAGGSLRTDAEKRTYIISIATMGGRRGAEFRDITVEAETEADARRLGKRDLNPSEQIYKVALK